MSFQDLEAGKGVAMRRMQDPSQAVGVGIFQINTSVSTFQRLVNTLGTPKDSLELRERLWHFLGSQEWIRIVTQVLKLVKDTSAKLREASETDFHSEVSTSKKIADAKLARDFQSVLKEFQKAQRLAAQRETTYAPFVPKEVPSYGNSEEYQEMSSSRVQEQQALVLASKRQEVVTLDNEIVFNEAIIEEREQGIQEIQQQIGEVNEIFKDLAVLVHDQGAIIDDISSNIQRSHAATIQGTSQLVKASKLQKSSSSLVISQSPFHFST
ncbi:hypothetical protein V2J09_015734 [Rumex salicifolius]